VALVARDTPGDATPNRGPNVFRPNVLWCAVNSVLGFLVFGATVAFVWQYANPLSIACGVVLASAGARLAVRSWSAHIAFSKQEVLVSGLLWSRRIQRSRILGVDTEPYWPIIVWETEEGKLRFTPLTVLSFGNTILPAAMFARSRKFLARLSSWSG